jgi:hypothetical protein
VTRIIASLVALAVIGGLIESGLDIASVAFSDDASSVAHEMHGHLGSDEGSPHGDTGDVDHFCHCVVHGAALAFFMNFTIQKSELKTSLFHPDAYLSLAIPPPVPPPNA